MYFCFHGHKCFNVYIYLYSSMHSLLAIMLGSFPPVTCTHGHIHTCAVKMTDDPTSNQVMYVGDHLRVLFYRATYMCIVICMKQRHHKHKSKHAHAHMSAKQKTILVTHARKRTRDAHISHTTHLPPPPPPPPSNYLAKATRTTWTARCGCDLRPKRA